ncbi:MAG: hypothetical protein ACFFFG_01920 [Candidatus Thorarchaeota archaeon]
MQKTQNTRTVAFLSIVLATILIPSAMKVAAVPWSASETGLATFSGYGEGISYGFKDNGQIEGYKTWSAKVSGGWSNWGQVIVTLTSDPITSDNWAGIYSVDFNTYFDGVISVGTQNLNVWLEITYKLKRGTSTIFTTTQTYDDTQSWQGDTETKTVSSSLSANTDYYVYVQYRYYTGIAFPWANAIDFWEHDTQYHQWQGWTLSHS